MTLQRDANCLGIQIATKEHFTGISGEASFHKFRPDISLVSLHLGLGKARNLASFRWRYCGYPALRLTYSTTANSTDLVALSAFASLTSPPLAYIFVLLIFCCFGCSVSHGWPSSFQACTTIDSFRGRNRFTVDCIFVHSMTAALVRFWSFIASPRAAFTCSAQILCLG